MKRIMKFAVGRATRIIVGGAVASGLYVAFLVIGPSIETKFFPVAVYETVTQVRDGTSLKLNTLFDKLRACEFIGSSWYATTKEGTTEKLYAKPIDDGDWQADRTRPLGRNYMRDWTVKLPDSVADSSTDQIFSVLHHRCGLPWLSQTVVGPFPLAH